MLQETINQLLDQLQRRVPDSRDYQRMELRDGLAGLPEPLAHFLIQHIDQRLTDRLDPFLSDPWFDTSSPAVRQQLDRLEQTMEEAARIPAGEWPEAVAEATHEVVAYLVDPVSELADFVFRHDSQLPIGEVQKRMAFFSPYSYLHSVFNTYADRQNLQTINRNRFEEVLRRVDRQMVADYGPEKWTGLFEPLYDVLAAGQDSTEPTAVSAELLHRLAANREFDALAGALQETSTSRLTSAQLREIISSALNAPASTASSAESSSTTGSRKTSSSNGPQPRWKQFQQGPKRSKRRPPKSSPEPKISPSSTPSETSESEPQKQKSEQKGQPLWQQFQRSKSPQTAQSSSSDQQPSRSARRPPDSVSTGQSSNTSNNRSQPSKSGTLQATERQVVGPIPDDQRDRFIRELFSGSREAYSEVLSKLQNVDSWEDASSLIANRVFLPHQVNIYSEPAVTFTDLVEARFRKKSSVQ